MRKLLIVQCISVYYMYRHTLYMYVNLNKYSVIGPLQFVSQVVEKHLAGEQGTHWDKTKKRKLPF